MALALAGCVVLPPEPSVPELAVGDVGAVVPLAPCDEATLTKVLSPASRGDWTAHLACSLTLPADAGAVTRTLVLEGPEASNAVVDCGGGELRPSIDAHALLIVSRQQADGGWERPEHVTVRGCRVFGTIRVSGMAANGQGSYLAASSKSAGHTERAQAAAPTKILLEGLDFTAQGPIPLYVSPGVTQLVLRRSIIRGTGRSTAVYFDAESAHNALLENTFGFRSDAREQVAIDGSASNRVIGNHFFGLEHGGLFVYRNCGEGGTVRHQAPRFNLVVNNVFTPRPTTDDAPHVHLASRNGARSYCGLDDGFPFGSSSSNLDEATDNVVAGNQVEQAEPVVRVDAEPNFLFDNERVEAGVERFAGCFDFERGRYLRHGEQADGLQCANNNLTPLP